MLPPRPAASVTRTRDPPTPYNIPSLGAAGGRLAPVLSPSILESSHCRAQLLPLNLIAHVLTFLEDDPRTLAAICAASRMLYYMAMPLLWKNLYLRSYNGVHSRKRTRDGEYKDIPEGMGGSSPFSAGLNALVTNAGTGRLVRSLRLVGEYGEGDAEVERCSKAGRVSENAMMLNICARAAVDNCPELESFHWDMRARLLPTSYQGLARLQHLQSLHIRFPNSRAPQPTFEIPAMPTLKRLIATDYDPLCYPDDLATVIFEARGLEDLQLHFAPRMRDVGEPSVQASHIIRKNVVAKRKIPVKRIGVYNLYAKTEPDLFARALDTSTVTDFTAINCFGKDEDEDGGLSCNFTDKLWLEGPYVHFPRLKVWRVDQLHRGHIKSFENRSDMERIYMINARYSQAESREPSSAIECSPASSNKTSNSSGTASSIRSYPFNTQSPATSSSLRDMYLDTICRVSGPSLKHLIFPNKWPMTSTQVSKLIRACPNLTQLSASIECANLEIWKILVPFLKDLWAMRLRVIFWYGCSDSKDGESAAVVAGTPAFLELLRDVLSSDDYDKLRYIEIGASVYEAQGWEEVVQEVPNEGVEEGDAIRQQVVKRRKVVEISREEVKDVAIWKYDTLDVI